MTLYGIIFYLLAAVIVVATCLAITRADLIHTVVYLVISFFGSAMLFYLLGAPFLAVLEVIIYAGAIMVLFLFIIMMLKVDKEAEGTFRPPQLFPALGLALMYLAVAVLLILNDPASQDALNTAMATPRELGYFVFQRYWLAVEIVSLLLLIALVAVIHLGKAKRQGTLPQTEDEK
jgi:NADH-quinone oxidoreductase subunit J